MRPRAQGSNGAKKIAAPTIPDGQAERHAPSVFGAMECPLDRAAGVGGQVFKLTNHAEPNSVLDPLPKMLRAYQSNIIGFLTVIMPILIVAVFVYQVKGDA